MKSPAIDPQTLDAIARYLPIGLAVITVAAGLMALAALKAGPRLNR